MCMSVRREHIGQNSSTRHRNMCMLKEHLHGLMGMLFTNMSCNGTYHT